MAAKSKKTQPPVHERMKAAGKRPVQLWLDKNERELIFGAAEDDGRSVTQYILHHILALAKKSRKKSGKSA